MGFYRKNIGNAQQVIRLAIGIATIVVAGVYLSGWPAIAAVIAGIGMVGTGLVGYCPMCAVVGVDMRRDTR